MAFKVTDGMGFYFAPASALAVAKTAATISNAAPPVAGSVGHGYQNGDELLLSSAGWDGITDTVVRAASVAADTLQLAGLDTSNQNFYAAGGGAGTTMRKIAANGWVEFPQVETYDPTGGDPIYRTVKLLKRRQATTFPSGAFDPVKITLKLAYDPALPTFQALLAVSRAVAPVAFKQVFFDGTSIYAYGNVAVKETPTNEEGVARTTAVFTALGLTVSY